jgi:hypothetical protein
MRRGLAALALVASALAARPVAASVEQFSSFDVLAPEVDDESVIDRLLSRAPREWEASWDSAATALRADQGCLTSAVWYQSNEFKARSPLGRHSWLDTGYLQRTDLLSTYEWFQFDVHRDLGGAGAIGVRVRPAYDKSRQDFALLWDSPDSLALRVRATFTFEDAFNSFWEFKQQQSGNRAEPYRRHPFEPALALDWRGARHRASASVTWLTPSRKAVVDPDPARSGSVSLWGITGAARLEHALRGVTLSAATENTQVLSRERRDLAAGDGHVFRRRWTAEAGVRGAPSPRLRAEATVHYEARGETWRPPVADAAYRAIDRVSMATLDWRAGGDWWLRTGVMFDRVGVHRAGAEPGFSYGTRNESRALLGFRARFGRVSLQVTEGVELDPEPYSVTWHHDKTFLHLATVF